MCDSQMPTEHIGTEYINLDITHFILSMEEEKTRKKDGYEDDHDDGDDDDDDDESDMKWLWENWDESQKHYTYV